MRGMVCSLIALMALSLRAAENYYIGAVQQAVQCATTDTAIPHNVFLEGFQGTGAENGAGLTEDDTPGDINLDVDTSALTTGKPAEACNEAAQFSIDAADVSIRNTTSFGGNANTTRNVVFYINVTTAPGAGDDIQIASCGSSTIMGSSTSWEIRLTESGGSAQIRAENGAVSSSTSYEALTTNTWHKVTVVCNGNETATFQVDSGTEHSFTANATGREYVHFGSVGAGAGESVTYLVDVIAVNTP